MTDITEKTVSLFTSDGQSFEVPIKIALYSNLLKTAMAEGKPSLSTSLTNQML